MTIPISTFKRIKILSLFSMAAFAFACSSPNSTDSEKRYHNNFQPGEIWLDSDSVHINAHGGGILFHEGVYYWFGEHKTAGRGGNSALVGIGCYSSTDLYNWKNEGIALASVEEEGADIEKGCVMERPKVIYNAETGKFVMWFHLELKEKGYEAARTAVAVSDQVTGPFTYLRSLRPNAGQWPMEYTEAEKNQTFESELEWWTPEWMEALKKGLFVARDFEGGQMSRDMTLFVDDDGTAYHIHSSEDNLTLHISELTSDYTDFTGKYTRLFPGGHNEAPAILKRNNTYYLIASGCTGWDPNAARSAVASSIWGPWEQLGNPCVGDGSDLTFESQSTFVLPVQGMDDAYIFMADRWRPKDPIDGRYIWLPITFENEKPVIKWQDEWDLSVFDSQTVQK
ncbi:glycoside hydrolase family 43 protein [Sunxiuqinia dokdonensis]|uniref:Beta-glucanase n=1 Tax=Sunxiuqinia dokdonensis TaxID=1409788 RepID=A0A0L8V2C2_9BACT|nr:glycoside hydrolase family 43 protein [Sunxiuqinia dokdonensis]KOH42571.1 hypothetical protein NC99_46110 [Sunxiuqinia dokdonensis]